MTDQLLENLPTSSNPLSRSGKHMLDGPAEFGVHSIHESAARIGVSRNSLVRLADSLGFETFGDLALAGGSDLLFAVTAFPGAWRQGDRI